MILVTSVSAISAVAILVTPTTVVASFSKIFEGLYVLLNQAINCGHVHSRKYFPFSRGLELLMWIPLIVIEDLLIFMNIPIAYDLISDLISLVYLFKRGTGQSLDNIHGFFLLFSAHSLNCSSEHPLKFLAIPSNES